MAKVRCPIRGAMTPPCFFGYGSLVNRRTHAYPEARPASARGWSRRWQGTRLRRVAYLTVVPDRGAEIAGLVAAVPGADWAALDLRETGYARHLVVDLAVDAAAPLIGPGPAPANAPGIGEVQIYAVEERHAEEGAHPILLSYLDTVIQGYLEVYGEAGARAFFDTTAGWHLPLLDDRAAPAYPRATQLTPAERAVVDANLARVRR